MSDSINTGITYSPSFEEWEAAHEAGLDLAMWEKAVGGYDYWFRAKVIAWYRLRRNIALNSEDAVNAKLKKKRR